MQPPPNSPSTLVWGADLFLSAHEETQPESGPRPQLACVYSAAGMSRGRPGQGWAGIQEGGEKGETFGGGDSSTSQMQLSGLGLSCCSCRERRLGPGLRLVLGRAVTPAVLGMGESAPFTVLRGGLSPSIVCGEEPEAAGEEGVVGGRGCGFPDTEFIIWRFLFTIPRHLPREPRARDV